MQKFPQNVGIEFFPTRFIREKREEEKKNISKMHPVYECRSKRFRAKRNKKSIWPRKEKKKQRLRIHVPFLGNLVFSPFPYLHINLCIEKLIKSYDVFQPRHLSSNHCNSYLKSPWNSVISKLALSYGLSSRILMIFFFQICKFAIV